MKRQAKKLTTSCMAVLMLCVIVPAVGAQHIVPVKTAAGASEGLINLSSCTYYNEYEDTTYAADCGTIVVHENRHNPASRLITLPIIRVRATGSNPTEPLFWLQGGPGGSNYVDSETDGLLEKHDLVMVGYRGVDSDIQLNCPEVAEAIDNAPGGFISEIALDAYAEGSKLCVERLTSEGVDLEGYSMHQTIEDMEEARKALGYDKIHLWSNSYGTRVALIYAWMYPESISRAALVTVNPPGGFFWEPDVVDDKLNQYAELCARDAYCSSRTDNLIATMRSVAENMPKSWMGIPIDQNIIKMASHMGFFESIETENGPPVNGPAIVDMWLDAAEGDASGMAIVSFMLDAMIIAKPFQSWGHFMAMGASSHEYFDPNRNYKKDLNPDNYIIGAPFSLYAWGMVQSWPTVPEYRDYSKVRPSDVEILLVNGTLDFSTPLRNAQDDLYPYLPNAQLVILEDIGHGSSISATQHEARKRMYTSFFDTGKADTSLYKYEAPVFDVKNSWSDLAKKVMTFLLLAVVIVVLLIGGVWYYFRRKSIGNKTSVASN